MNESDTRKGVCWSEEEEIRENKEERRKILKYHTLKKQNDTGKRKSKGEMGIWRRQRGKEMLEFR